VTRTLHKKIKEHVVFAPGAHRYLWRKGVLNGKLDVSVGKGSLALQIKVKKNNPFRIMERARKVKSKS